ncbi:hypothetical protein [Okeania sp. KiyG1]|uniref:hypothetical protein n=1 Tax=Okeania sp. KiyG1 TaxID=2720165 RepID=UPI0019C09EE9|nr:hypothetical protein [Okeania sp. KiyG1]GGA42065.1 hypothetical protein CYANOKiyG1_60580 [Okeania sp. KiyG1]GGA42543.1 hypothetical protein CYANOKiyG1_61150 [Okeania sp. KiyG1]
MRFLCLWWSEAVKIYQLETNTVHLDSTSFHVHGDEHTDEDEYEEDLEPKTIAHHLWIFIR